ncbi:hypothetical protein L6R53_31285 [Myxococcota bacterium]|nr:hypothetical protein [Myxococcota bacterium]
MPRSRPHLLLPLLAALAGGCRSTGELVLVNGSSQAVTALFGPDGADLLQGAKVTPGGVVTVPLPELDTASTRLLEGYSPAGACASHPATPGRWVLSDASWDPAGCEEPAARQR